LTMTYNILLRVAIRYSLFRLNLRLQRFL